MAEENEEQQFSVQRIFLKDLSFECPQGAKVFLKQWKPAVNQELNTSVDRVDEDLYEVVLTMTVTAKLEEDTAFLIEIHQGGIFGVKGIEGAQLAQVLNTVCPQILFPYAREAIDSALVKGTFPPLMLPPINFEALYAQALVQQQQEEEAKH